MRPSLNVYGCQIPLEWNSALAKVRHTPVLLPMLFADAILRFSPRCEGYMLWSTHLPRMLIEPSPYAVTARRPESCHMLGEVHHATTALPRYRARGSSESTVSGGGARHQANAK